MVSISKFGDRWSRSRRLEIGVLDFEVRRSDRFAKVEDLLEVLDDPVEPDSSEVDKEAFAGDELGDLRRHFGID